MKSIEFFRSLPESTEMTVGDLIDSLMNYDRDCPVVLVIGDEVYRVLPFTAREHGDDSR